MSKKERAVLALADNCGGFVISADADKCVLHSLEKKGYLAYYDACYWITHDGEKALKENK